MEFEEEECRVCRGEAETGRRLFAPCKCSGSIRYVHSDCLKEWLAISKKDVCELCGYTFSFRPLYAEGCPETLPIGELLMSVAIVALKKWIPLVIRGILVLISWLIVAPWCTSWLYRLWLLRAATMGSVNFNDRIHTLDVVFEDVFAGLILIVVVVCSFLSLMSLADFLRFNMDQIQDEIDGDADAPDDLHLRQRAILVAQELEMQGLNAEEVRGENFIRLIERVDGVDEWIAERRQEEDDSDSDSDDSDDDDGEIHPRRRHVRPAVNIPNRVLNMPRGPPLIPVRRVLRVREGDNLPLFEEAIQQIPHAAVFRPHVARNIRPDPRIADAINRGNRRRQRRANNDQQNNNNQAQEWDDDMEHMEINIAMDELVGFRGPLYLLVRNVSWFLAFNGAYLGIFAFIPYTLGSTIVSTLSKFSSVVPPLDPSILEGPVDNMPALYRVIGMVLNTTETARVQGDCLQLVDLCTCALGYFAFCGTIVMWRVLVSTISSYNHRPLLVGLLWFLSCLNAVVKVSTLLLLKMIILPILLGIGMDFATLQLFLQSPWERLAYCMENMLATLLVHWVLGITFMLFVTVAVLQLREVLHPDILAATIRPQEANPDILKSLLSEKSIKHARRMILSLAIYAALLMLLIYSPVRFAYYIAPTRFPLELHFYHIFAPIQVPLELVIAHMTILSVLETYKNEIGHFQYHWMVSMGKKLGLTEYLLPRVPAIPGSGVDEIVLTVPPLTFNHNNNAQQPAEQRFYGARYMPWPEEGMVDPTVMEYNLLPRKHPSKVLLRLAALIFCCWLTTIVIIGVATLGPLFVGRVSVAMAERFCGIRHDSIAFATGVFIMWMMISGYKVLRVLRVPENEIHPSLRDQGYEVSHRTRSSLLSLVVSWAIVLPLMIGLLGALWMTPLATQWPNLFEMHGFGFAVLHAWAWLMCCFEIRKRRPNNNNNNNNEEGAPAPAANAINRWDELLQAEPGVLTSLRLAYEQLCFHLQAHEEGIENVENIGAKCFDGIIFRNKVVRPLTYGLFMCLVLPWLSCKIDGLVHWSNLAEPVLYRLVFATQLIGAAMVYGKPYVGRWFKHIHDSVRDERYLIGKELNDMLTIFTYTVACPSLGSRIARSPGPIYHSVHENLERSPKKKGGVVIRKDYAAPPTDLKAPIGHRDSWIKNQFSPSISVHDHGVHVAPNLYEANYEVVKSKFPAVSFPKSERFLSQKVCMTDKNHQRELITTDSPGPKYNVEIPALKSNAPKFTFSKGQVNPIRVGSPVKSHRESWLSVINRKGLFVLPAAILEVDPTISASPTKPGAAANTEMPEEPRNQYHETRPLSSNFGTAPRFGLREHPRKDQATSGMSRVQYISARHARENMGEFSPGPIYTPHKPAPPGGRLAPAPHEPSPLKDNEVRGPDNNLSSRSCWLSGNIRKNSGREIMLMRTGDVAPGPGAYCHQISSFGGASFSHNVRVKRKDASMTPRRASTSPRKTRPSPRTTISPRQQTATLSPRPPSPRQDDGVPAS
ncbi:E3 ubiquitin-protein ligase MARCH6 (membrane-associated RING finger protein 6) [Thraustotheca clavata]|uniref:RING-type E3 ubiquitin transferase n=1 Tax=Thraustotheca clavata TaxID=74557 RepID=A0A1W0AAI0_9STRA|nr:E3 ubiquitin-protein ligase MARCH6 (membrane-associated RING finger protein 6) [Thraustotheca clavata]